MRIQYPGAIYHVMGRGNAKHPIVAGDEDRRTFFGVLAEVVERFRWLCHAYCLMTNHYHLLVETLGANLSSGMRQLNGVYAQRYNRQHDRVGHLFQGRFKSPLIQRDTHLLEAIRYIVLNPVEAGLTAAPGDYRWSSYRATAGLAPAPPWLTTAWVLSQFGKTEIDARDEYRRFIASGAEKASNGEAGPGPLVGDESFRAAHRPYLQELRTLREIPRAERFADLPTLETILDGIEFRRGGAERNEAIRRACNGWGYSFSEVARALGLHPCTVGRIAGGRPNAQCKT